MAILQKGSTETGAFQVASGVGTMKFTISGDDYFVNLDHQKEGFTVPASTTWELLGSSYVVTGTAAADAEIWTEATGASALGTSTNTARITGGSGNVYFGGIKVGVNEFGGSFEFNIASHEAADDIPLTIPSGAIVFVQPQDEISTNRDRALISTAADDNDIIYGGDGTAVLADSTASSEFSKMVRLNELVYPFTLDTNDTLTPTAASFIVIDVEA